MMKSQALGLPAPRQKHSNPIDPELLRLEKIVESGLKVHRLRRDLADAEKLFRVRKRSFEQLIAEATAEFEALQAVKS